MDRRSDGAPSRGDADGSGGAGGPGGERTGGGASATSPPAEACRPLTAKPEVVASAPGARVFATDGRDLFWSDGRGIVRRPVGGGEARTIVPQVTAVADVQALAVDGDEVWFSASRWTDRGCLGLVGHTGRDGGKITQVGPAGCPTGFALAPETVAIAHESTSHGSGSIVGTLYAVPRAPGGKTVVLRRHFNGSGGVAVDGTHAYFPDDIGALDRIPLADGPVERVVRRPSGIDSATGNRFAVDETSLFFFVGHLNFDGLRLARVPKSGGEISVLGAALPPTRAGADYPRAAIQLTATHAVWSHPGGGEVLRARKDGACPVERVARDQPGADWVTFAGGSLWWLNTGSSPPEVVRLSW